MHPVMTVQLVTLLCAHLLQHDQGNDPTVKAGSSPREIQLVTTLEQPGSFDILRTGEELALLKRYDDLIVPALMRSIKRAATGALLLQSIRFVDALAATGQVGLP